ncbi:alpha/beta fold hydrolase [Tundrisphaera sp. TA3]|uniref:alpha/beta fold hydrolase n=1 Tax=Tundrisphaera sp. TA3 TaxID=3435775 RepID=UPI003EBB01A1
MLTHAMVMVALVSTIAGPGLRRGPLLVGGSDPARGVLVNHNPGVPPFAPPDPSRPTVVFIHGFNPMPRTVHFTMAERLADGLNRRGLSNQVNLLAWDWNAATFDSLSVRSNVEDAVGQGHLLAAALIRAGVAPSRTHLIGHSAGGLVATSAAWDFATLYGQHAAQLTLLEPAAFYHDVIFGRLSAGSLASRVENYWSPGPSAFGREVAQAGVQNHRVAGPTPFVGVVCPLRSNHLSLVRWYADSIADPNQPAGFNASLLLAGR